MWDLKPDAPAEIKGEFKEIDTKASGVKISEVLEFPTVARLNPNLLKITKMFERVQILGQDFLRTQLVW